ncbi:MAG: UDP-N-acetylmuramoyl-L-alanine--D-glutamate ligase [Flavobacteriaceae bacterium]|nr:UDP-N-acetylmuramoyl-L-alanine--D-glutamate ligase [Flavobacteriaceae bacterium]NVJ71712.1 UDP-N-acetylmuramoyl-L-alanine--D-glutamate ligase [Flavobacteriaceae bacterium]
MKTIVVLGAGESGVGAALLAADRGFAVFVSDRGSIASKYKNILDKAGISYEEGEHTKEKILAADLIVKSPGIPDTVPLIQEAINKGIKIWSEIEFASRYTEACLIGITGSNGKTTTTMLTHHLLSEGGLSVGMGGNIGKSFAGLLLEEPKEHYVLELSSFQLDGIEEFKPHIAVICNITPDHLDRYNYDFNAYIESKFRITKNQTKEDYLIYDADDPVLVDYINNHQIQAQLVPFSISEQLEYGAYLDHQTIYIKTNQNTISMKVDTLALEGLHNVKNTMAASAAASLLQIRKESIRNSVQHFQGAAHRMEKVLKINHVNYINDSKATNVNATFYALESVKSPIVWIVGGVDKGNDYSSLMPLVREKVKAIICLGEDNQKLKAAFEGIGELFVETYAMSEAVKVAYKVAERGDSVLLSPACASFDLFENYEDRGNQFKEAVRNL